MDVISYLVHVLFGTTSLLHPLIFNCFLYLYKPDCVKFNMSRV